jgi:lipoate-protein ligase A
MALDMALLERARTVGEGVWRCYAWSRPTVSFGRNESVAGRFDRASVTQAGLDAVRRPTGGRALLHGREVTYSATLPLADSIGWREAYAAINAILLDALRELGVAATLVSNDWPADVDAAAADAAPPRSAPTRPDGPLCFERPALGEIAVGAAKLVGSAVWRERGAYLQHGSILLHDDQPLLLRATIPDAPDHQRAHGSLPPAASLDACFAADGRPTPTWSDVADALEASLARRADVRVLPLDRALVEATSHAADAYTRDGWLWRR